VLGLLSDVTEEWANQLREEELHEALRRSQRLEAVGQLAGGIAHDFNNVLAAVTGSIELLIDDVPEGQPMEYALEIEHAAHRGAALVRQLLTYAQRDGAEPTIVDVNDIVAGTAGLLRRTIGSNIQLQVSTSEHACRILADPTHIEQIILNLAVNARDAMPDGGILWIATAIDFDDDAPENDRVALSVTDTGSGIAPEVREQMFQPFVTTKEVGKGTGLGLATVLSIVQRYEGRIHVISQVDQGTTFEISFPRCFGTANASAAPDASDEFAGAGREILLVEDDAPVRAALNHLLQRLDFAVTPAANAVDALRLVDQQRFRVRRLDIHHRLDHRVDLPLDVVRLVDHECHLLGGRRDCRIAARDRDLPHDAKELEGIDSTDDEVVVRVLATVEMEAAEEALREEDRDDLLDVPPL